MKTHRLIMPEDLNQYGFLFGGKMLSWVDEASWIAASLDFPECRFVTVGMDKVEFLHGVESGVILEIECNKCRLGETSISYDVFVKRGRSQQGRGQGAEVIFSTCVSFVNLNENGEKCAINAAG